MGQKGTIRIAFFQYLLLLFLGTFVRAIVPGKSLFIKDTINDHLLTERPAQLVSNKLFFRATNSFIKLHSQQEGGMKGRDQLMVTSKRVSLILCRVQGMGGLKVEPLYHPSSAKVQYIVPLEEGDLIVAVLQPRKKALKKNAQFITQLIMRDANLMWKALQEECRDLELAIVLLNYLSHDELFSVETNDIGGFLKFSMKDTVGMLGKDIRSRKQSRTIRLGAIGKSLSPQAKIILEGAASAKIITQNGGVVIVIHDDVMARGPFLNGHVDLEQDDVVLIIVPLKGQVNRGQLDAIISAFTHSGVKDYLEESIEKLAGYSEYVSIIASRVIANADKKINTKGRILSEDLSKLTLQEVEIGSYQSKDSEHLKEYKSLSDLMADRVYIENEDLEQTIRPDQILRLCDYRRALTCSRKTAKEMALSEEHAPASLENFMFISSLEQRGGNNLKE